MIGNRVRVTIESMVYKGYGLARAGGKVLFLPYTVEGDEAWCEILEEKKSYSLGRMDQLLIPSIWRVDPPCPYFGRCGGCQWQHIASMAQTEFKRKILIEILRRLGGLKELPPICVTPPPQPYGYRVRVQLKTGGGLGYFHARSHRLVDITHCFIAHPLVNQIISLLREKLLEMTTLPDLRIHVSPDEGRGILILSSPSSEAKIRFLSDWLLTPNSIVKGVVILEKRKPIILGNAHLTLDMAFTLAGHLHRLQYRASPQSFYQINLEQNQQLIQTVVDWAAANEPGRGLDLYAGIGNFTLPLATGAKEMWGIEENEAAVADARFNAARHGLHRCHFLQGKVDEVLTRFRGQSVDLVLLDPPRSGSQRVVSQITQLKPKRIIYISCEPTILSRDLALFARQGYHLERLALIDLFPQSYRMEVVALLRSPCSKDIQ